MAYLFALKLSEMQTWRNQDERRYELTREVAERVLPLLTAHLPVVRYDETTPTTMVATLYFDTVDGHYFERAKSRSGVSSIKIRSREYLAVSDDDERRVLNHSPYCYLERKERKGTIRQKDRVQILKTDLAPIIEGLHQTSCKILQDEIRRFALVPAVISMYERRVWGSDNGLRVTFDERIRYYRPPDRPYQSVSAMQPAELGEPAAIGPKRILEVKNAADASPPHWLAELLSELPEASGFSKFLDGMVGLQRRRRSPPSLTRPIYKLP